MTTDKKYPYIPCGFHILVELHDAEIKTESGIILATGDEAKREQGGINTATVLAFGPTCYKGFAGCEKPEDWGVTVGDEITFDKYLGTYPNYDKFPRLATIPDSGVKTVKRGVKHD